MTPRLNIQIIFQDQPGRIGPGKVRLLELVAETGSISAAARAMQMSYRQAWLLLDEINGLFDHGLLVTQQGGQARGGATLTPLGEEVVADYRKFEAECGSLIEKKYKLLGKRTRKQG